MFRHLMSDVCTGLARHRFPETPADVIPRIAHSSAQAGSAVCRQHDIAAAPRVPLAATAWRARLHGLPLAAFAGHATISPASTDR